MTATKPSVTPRGEFSGQSGTFASGDASSLAKLYALRYSSNYHAQDQLGWIQRGWQDGKAGVWK